MRATFGQWGSRGFISPYRVVAVTYWFAAQALAAAIGVRAIVDVLTGYDVGFVPASLAVAAIAAMLAIIGFDALRYFVRIVLPLTVIAVVVMIVLFVTTEDPAYSTTEVLGSNELTFTWLGFSVFMTAIWGGQLTSLLSAADLGRYARSKAHMRVGIVAGTTAGAFVAAWVGAYAAAAAEKEPSAFAAAATLTQQKTLLAFLLLVVLANTISVNVLNLYQGGLALVNSLPRTGRFVSTLLVSIPAVAFAAATELIRDAEEWFIHLGNVAAPIAGVVLVDYVLLKRMRIDVAALFTRDGRYRYVAGVNPAAAVALVVGVAVYYAVPDSWLKVAWGIVVAGAVYFVGALLQGHLWPQLRDAVAPAEESADAADVESPRGESAA
jgi:purine-cytosine permease-like protein